jgi:hydrogenase expression/formation protein HypC
MCLAIPGRVIHIEAVSDPSFRMARVDFTGLTKSISLSLTPEAQLGDYVLVHVGFALTVISAEEAEKTLAFLKTVAGPEELHRELGGDERDTGP